MKQKIKNLTLNEVSLAHVDVNNNLEKLNIGKL